jgi:periplasmic protein TonB
MDVNKILSADVLDIIFEGRNKEYGAYDLRKSYKKRITIAVLAMLAICVLLLLFSILANSTKKAKTEIVVQDVNLAEVKQEEKKPEPPPPPPPPKQEPPKVEITKFTPPKIVKDEEVKEPPPPIEKVEVTKIGDKDQEGKKDDGVVAPPPETGTGPVAAPAKDEEDYDKVFYSVQRTAEFNGGMAAWKKYLERNLNQNAPTDNGAPGGKYTVILSFTVDKNGNISDIAADNDPGYGTKDEAIRVLKKSPQWTPAEQNGRKVIFRHKQSITFVVTEE